MIQETNGHDMKLLAAQQVKLGFIGLGNILKTAAREKVPMPATEAAIPR